MEQLKEIIVLKDGQIFADGDHTVLTKDNIKKIYGISVNIMEHKGGLVIIPETSLDAKEINLSRRVFVKKDNHN